MGHAGESLFVERRQRGAYGRAECEKIDAWLDHNQPVDVWVTECEHVAMGMWWEINRPYLLFKYDLKKERLKGERGASNKKAVSHILKEMIRSCMRIVKGRCEECRRSRSRQDRYECKCVHRE